MVDFSVIIPAYNNLQLFERATLSVLKQKDIAFEIIVVDDSTNDKIKEYIETLQDNHIYYFHNKQSLGAVKNWNYGLSLATGMHCMLLHHDESLPEELHLKKCLDRLSEGYNIVVSNIKIHINDKIKNGLCPAFLKRITLKFPASLLVLNLVGPTACVILNRTVLQYFDEKLCWLVDSEWYYRILENKRICYLNDLYVNSLHGHEGQITKQINIREKEKNDIRFIRQKYTNNINMQLSMIFIVFVRIARNIKLSIR